MTLRIDFVSDVACPWCAVGLNALERALESLGDEVPVELHFQPFELNPDMGEEGVDTVPYLARKYGITAAQVAQNQAVIRERGAAVGFQFGARPRVWNTFDSHRLLAWAATQAPDAQRKLKHALLQAYHGDGLNPGARDVLLQCAAACGLDPTAAAAVLDSDDSAQAVREAEAFWQQAGIHSVPSVIINRQHLIQGGQPPEVFAQALRQIAASGQVQPTTD